MTEEKLEEAIEKIWNSDDNAFLKGKKISFLMDLYIKKNKSAKIAEAKAKIAEAGRLASEAMKELQTVDAELVEGIYFNGVLAVYGQDAYDRASNAFGREWVFRQQGVVTNGPR